MVYNFIKKLIIFLSPVILGVYPLDLFISSQLKKSSNFNGEIEVWEAIKNGRANCDIAIYGTSRAWLQFDPEIISEALNKTVYNFGIDGHNFWLQYYRHLEFLKYNKTPETILLSVDVFTLEKRKNLYNFEQFLPYALWDSQLKKYTESYEGFQQSDYQIPFFRYAGKLRALKEALRQEPFSFQEPRPMRKNGFKSMNLKWGEKMDRVNDDFGYSAQLDQNSVVLLEQFVKQCVKQGIRLVLIYAPEQIEGQNKIENRGKIVKIYKQLSQKYNLLYLDYSKDKMNLDKKYFYNSMHLNSEGASLFSEKLAKDLRYFLNNTTK